MHYHHILTLLLTKGIGRGTVTQVLARYAARCIPSGTALNSAAP